jgi:hypothetical protein
MDESQAGRVRTIAGICSYSASMTALMAVFISSNMVEDTEPVFLKTRFVDTDRI